MIRSKRSIYVLIIIVLILSILSIVLHFNKRTMYSVVASVAYVSNGLTNGDSRSGVEAAQIVAFVEKPEEYAKKQLTITFKSNEQMNSCSYTNIGESYIFEIPKKDIIKASDYMNSGSQDVLIVRADNIASVTTAGN